MTDLKTLAAESLAWITKKAPGLEAELYLGRGEERGVELREGELDGLSHSSGEGAGLRLLAGERMGFASAGGADLATIQELFRKVSSQLTHLEADPAKAFAAPQPSPADAALSDSLWDETLFTLPFDLVVPRLKEMGALALSVDKRLASVLRAGYGESRGESVIANTRGVFSHERGSSASVGLSALSREEADIQVGSAFQAACRSDVLDFAAVGRDAGRRTAALLGSRKLPGGRRSVVFDPWVAGELLELVAALLCADQVQRGKSLLAGKLGCTVASPAVTFLDDPRRQGGLASALFDDEGCPTSAQAMIEGGVVKEFFYDTYTANKDKRRTNGCAGRGSYKGLPSPGCSNFFMKPGSLSREALIADTKDGILVMDIMGMHMADPISGEFSVGVSGLSIQGGRIGFPVKNAMISGNLVELLGRVDAVGSDLTFYGAMGAPTFRVSEMTVA